VTLAFARLGGIALSVLLLHACGGSGGDGSNGGGGNGGGGLVPRLSVNQTEVDVSAAPGDEAPRSVIVVTVTNPPNDPLYIGAQYSTSGISSLDFAGTSDSSGNLDIFFRAPAEVENGTYEDTIELHVCTDEACNDDIAGSPVTIRTSYVISSGIVAQIDRNSIAYRTDTQDSEYRKEIVRLTVDRLAAGGVYVQTREDSDSIIGVSGSGVFGTEQNLEIEFVSGGSLRPGIYEGSVTITVCYDSSCARQLDGSPFTVSTHVTIDTAAEPGVDVLEVASRTTLPHDVIDAEYSDTLDAVVMAGTYPGNALYVYDINSGATRQLPLSLAPTAVSVAPDGLTAAVGHDGRITVVDLAQVAQPGAPAPTLLDVSTDVVDLVLGGDGRVHALARPDTWHDIHTIDIATNTEQVSSGMSLYGGALGRLHPSGDFIYTAENGISSDNLQKWDVASGAVAWVADMPQHHENPVCGNLWFRDDGASIFTSCGNVFSASTDPAADMVHDGRLELFAPRAYDWLVKSLSHSAANGEIALIEAETNGCVHSVPEAGRCYTHLATYESSTLDRQSLRTVGPVTVGERSYPQRGLFVFHDGAGNRKIILSKLDVKADPHTEYYLSIVP
jgi:hypothetical protein